MSEPETIAPHGGTLVDLLIPASERASAASEAEHLPKLVVNERELSDLEMLTVGALSPLRGFVPEADYVSILETMHLSNGLAWSIPVTLSLTDEDVRRLGAGNAVALLPAEGAHPIAIVEVSEVFKRDRHKEALGVFGTEDLEHPGVKALHDAGLGDLDRVRWVLCPHYGAALVERHCLTPLGIPAERTLAWLGRRYGHIGAGDQFLGLEHLLDHGLLDAGDYALLLGIGVGMSFSAAIVRAS